MDNTEIIIKQKILNLRQPARRIKLRKPVPLFLRLQSHHVHYNVISPVCRDLHALATYLQYKTRTAHPDCGPGIERGLGIKGRLLTGYKTRTRYKTQTDGRV